MSGLFGHLFWASRLRPLFECWHLLVFWGFSDCFGLGFVYFLGYLCFTHCASLYVVFGSTSAQKMSSKKKAASSARVGDAHEKSTDKLSVKEFRDRFCIPNGVIVEFLNGEDVISTEKAEQDTVIFSKEQ